MRGKDKISQAHLDALPVLLQPLIKCAGTGRPITSNKAMHIIYAWDQARKVNKQKEVVKTNG